MSYQSNLISPNGPGLDQSLLPGAFPLPVEFDWDRSTYPVNARRLRRGVYSTAFDGRSMLPSIKAIFDGVASGTTGVYYADVGKADNTGNGLTKATAKRSIKAARLLGEADASKSAIIIYVRAGWYSIDENFNGGVADATQFPTKPIALIAIDGTVQVTTAVFNIAWAADGADTSGRTFTATRGNLSWLVDRMSRDSDGFFNQFKLLASADAVRASSGLNAYYVDGANLVTAKRADGAVISRDNTAALLLNQVLRTKTVPLYASGIEFLGGDTGCLQCNDGGTFDVMIEDGALTYWGLDIDRLNPNQKNAITADFKGMVLLNRVLWGKGAGDGLNLHGFTIPQAEMLAGKRCVGLAIDCKGRSVGSPVVNSCNHLTIHGDDSATETACRMIAINFDGGSSGGGMVACGGSNHMLLLGGTLDGDRGDNGANTAGLAIGHSGTSRLFLIETAVRRSEVALKVEGNATTYVRDLQASGGRVLALGGARILDI